MFSQSCMILCACLAVVAIANAGSSELDLDGRIIGGQVITIDKTTYLVQLRTKNQHFCGGTLVDPLRVVTAAHCLDGLDLRTVTVVGGASTIHELGVQRRVSAAYVPKPYTKAVKHYDIAVLKLDSPMMGKDIATIRLCSRALKRGDMLQVSGWGKISEQGPYPDYLSTVFVPTISKDVCTVAHQGVASITSSMVCATVPGVKDSCTGDSGGPAVNNNELCAVVSWGIGCGRASFPGVYTGIYETRDFLDYALKQ